MAETDWRCKQHLSRRQLPMPSAIVDLQHGKPIVNTGAIRALIIGVVAIVAPPIHRNAIQLGFCEEIPSLLVPVHVIQCRQQLTPNLVCRGGFIRRRQPPGKLQNPLELGVLTRIEVMHPAVHIISNDNIHLHLSCWVWGWGRLPQLRLTMLPFLYASLGMGAKCEELSKGVDTRSL